MAAQLEPAEFCDHAMQVWSLGRAQVQSLIENGKCWACGAVIIEVEHGEAKEEKRVEESC